MAATPFLRFPSSRVLEICEGRAIGLWHCIFAFPAHNHSFESHFSSTFNPKLKSIPTLLNDLQSIFELSCRAEDWQPSQLALNGLCRESRDVCHQSNRSLPILDQDLNYLLYSVATFEQADGKQIEENGLNWKKNASDVAKKKKRAAAEDIARIALEDLAKYFDLPILEASRQLKIGLTVLKRKCREFGVGSWPHRKIKSLDSLSHNLLEEAARQKKDNKDAVMAVAKRQRMLEQEKETIERKPSTWQYKVRPKSSGKTFSKEGTEVGLLEARDKDTPLVKKNQEN